MVHLNWTGGEHYASHELPCEECDGPTNQRDHRGRPCHRECAELVVAREKLGHRHTLIADERFGFSYHDLIDELRGGQVHGDASGRIAAHPGVNHSGTWPAHRGRAAPTVVPCSVRRQNVAGA